MKTRTLLLLVLACLLPSLSMAQGDQADVLSQGDPPLTKQMVQDFEHFIQWSLRTPLTAGQQYRIQNYLIDSWKSDDKAEITRTLNILELRGQIQQMGLADSQWAAYQMGEYALDSWNQSPNAIMAQWGISMFNSSHRALLRGTPPLTRQMDEAYEELGYFIMNNVDGAKPTHIDAVERTTLADSLARQFPKLTDDVRANFAILPKVWVQLREAWPTLDDATKSSLKAAWKSGLYPSGKASKDPVINRLTNMTWVLKPEVFSKMQSVGAPYGLGWGA